MIVMPLYRVLERDIFHVFKNKNFFFLIKMLFSILSLKINDYFWKTK